MRTQILVTVGMMVSLAVAACSGAPSESVSGDDQDLSATESITGSFVVDGDNKEAIDFRADGHFFRDTTRILNGVFVAGAEPTSLSRDGGTYKFNAKTHLLTLHVTEGPFPGTESYAYTFKAPAILNGVFIAGTAPEGTLAPLTMQAAPGSQIVFSPEKFKQVNSWCTSTTDCNDEQKDGTWVPLSHGVPPAHFIEVAACDTKANACSMTFKLDQ